jgi:GT2 family glycosyltransferase
MAGQIVLPPSRMLHFTRSPIVVAGSCIDSAGRPARVVRIRLGRRVITCETNGEPGSFRVTFRTPIGLKYLVIEAELADGTTLLLGRRMICVYGLDNDVRDYELWIDANARLNPPAPPPAHGPLISVLMPVFNPPERWLRRAIDSVLEQTYARWELCIADDASTAPHVRRILEKYASADARIKVVYRPVNGHISTASNSALGLATGEFTALLDHDDELSPHALAEVARALATHPDARVLYSDEDKIDTRGRRYDPYFKPDWNPDLLRSQNYFCHLSVYQTSLLREIGGFRIGYEGSQDWDLALRAVERVRDDQIVHIPRVLYHWRAIPGSTALSQSQKSYHLEAARKALQDHVTRTGIAATVAPVKGGHWRIQHHLPPLAPRVSIIIPTRNHLGILKPCISAILERTTYPDYEILIVDNGSDEPAALEYLHQLKRDPRIKIIRDDGPFNFSALNNRAVAHASGTLLAFVNNDVEPITPDWLGEMVSLALRPGTGAVGAMLYYPDDRVQHAGVVLGIAGPQRVNGIAGHAFKKFPRGHGGCMNRMRLLQNYSAVTAACLVVRRSVFEQVGGFDEHNLAIAFNDVDFCLRVLKTGLRNVWTPFAELYHHESASRGPEDSPEKQARAAREAAYMRRIWGPLLDRDPAYNPNLTLVHEDFSLSWPPQDGRQLLRSSLHSPPLNH